MSLFRQHLRLVAWAGLLVGLMMATGPVYAGDAEVALLQSYVGSWKGSGVLIGGEGPERFNCRMTIAKGNRGKINYAGRCNLAGTNLSVSGAIGYIDAAGRYEAAMTSNATFRGDAVGRKQGSGIVFNLRERDTDEEGNDMTVSSRIVLRGGEINVQFNVVFNDTGDRMEASVPFSRIAP